MRLKINNTYSLFITSLFILLSFSAVLFRKPAFISITVILSLSILILYQISIKKKILFNKKAPFIVIILPFILILLGLFWTENYLKGYNFVVRSIPLLVLPFFYFFFDKKPINNGIRLIISYFPILTITTYSLYFLFGLFLFINGYGDYLYYNKFSEISNIHNTSMGLIINISTLFLISKKYSYNKIVFNFFIFIHFIFLLIILSKVSLFVFGLSIIYCQMQSKGNRNIKILKIFIFLILSLFILKPILEDRIIDKKMRYNEHYKPIEMLTSFYNNDVMPRYYLWKSNINALNKKNLLFGVGTGGDESKRVNQYYKYNLQNAIHHNYNAHNQYIEILYNYGLFGLCIFIIHIIYVIKLLIKQRNWIYFLLYLYFLIYFLIDSILTRSVNIFLYAFTLSFIVTNISSKDVKAT